MKITSKTRFSLLLAMASLATVVTNIAIVQGSFFFGARNACFRNNFGGAGLRLQQGIPWSPYHDFRPYYPLRSGSFSLYRRSNGSTYAVNILAEKTTINGVVTTAMADSDGYVQYLTNDDNGLRVHGLHFEPTGDSMIFVPPILLFKNAQPFYDRVESTGVAVTSAGNFPYTSRFSFYYPSGVFFNEGFESITVPLRPYDTVRLSGFIALCDEVVSHTINLARGVGAVRGQQTFQGNLETIEMIATNAKTMLDFDGDGKSDQAIYRDGVWAMMHSSINAVVSEGVGASEWTPVPADYDGDGKTDEAVYLNGTWVVIRSSDSRVAVIPAGGPAFLPAPADYDGDGKADIAVYLAGAWSVIRSSDGTNAVFAHGGPGWIPVPADYDGDGRADLAVYVNGAWAIKRSSDNGTILTGHGGPGWEPVPGDYDGDGKADIAVYMNGAWSILRSSDNGITVLGHGGPDWVPVPGDYDGDGKTDVAVYHTIGAWSIKRSSDGAIQVVGHGGGPTDVPLN